MSAEEEPSRKAGSRMNSNEREPQNIAVTPSSRDYLGKFAQSGLLEGERGQQEIPDDVKPVLEALHHVLGGGKVSITIDSPGDAAVVEELNGMLNKAKDEYNQAPQGKQIFYF